MDLMNLVVSPMANILILIYAFIGNFGVAIILFTVLIKAVTHPAMASQIRSSAKLQEFTQSEEWKKIQEKYKDDKETLAREQMRMYQEKGINPMSSCLPTLIQLPIIIGLYQAISRVMATTPLHMVDLVRSINPILGDWVPAARISSLLPIKTTFLWMNLGQPERLFADVLPFGGLPLLALIVAITTYIQSKLTMPPPSANVNPDDPSAQMSQSMTLTMPLMMLMMSINFPSGLAIYFITSNIVGILQYAILGKANWSNLFKFDFAPAPEPAPKAKSKNRK